MYLSVGPHAVRGGDLAFTLSAAKMRAGTGKIHHASVRVFSLEGVSNGRFVFATFSLSALFYPLVWPKI